MKFKIGDVVRINWTHGKTIYCVIRAEHGNCFQVESLNSESFEAMGKQHRRWVKKSIILSL